MDTYKNNEKRIIKKFLKNGYIIFDIQDKRKLKELKSLVLNESSKILRKNIDHLKKSDFLNNTHNFIDKEKLNIFRLKIYNKLNLKKNFLINYYTMGKKYVDLICGNELAIQKKINLSIQLPRDNSSILPIHSDVWSGNSPFEVVLWIPLVSVKKTKSMFILSPELNKYYYKNLKKFKSSEKIYLHSKNKLNG